MGRVVHKGACTQGRRVRYGPLWCWPYLGPSTPLILSLASMPDVTPPSRSNPLPARPCSIIGIWSQLAACPSSLSPDSGSPSPVPACPTVRVQGSRHPPGSGLHRSGLRGQWAQGSVPLRRHAAAPRRPER
jgi:hypothetical protein